MFIKYINFKICLFWDKNNLKNVNDSEKSLLYFFEGLKVFHKENTQVLCS